MKPLNSGKSWKRVNWFLVVVGEIEILEGELRADDVNAWKVKERNGKKGERLLLLVAIAGSLISLWSAT